MKKHTLSIPFGLTPVVDVIGGPEGVIIVMADENLVDQNNVKKAARNCDIAHVFTSVYNGEQLMNLLLKRDVYFSEGKIPDLIIMDIHLRLLDGFEVLKRIKSHSELKNIPVYILTKDRNSADVDRAMQLGVNDYFKKPLSDHELQVIIKGICGLNFKDGHLIHPKASKHKE
jgi:CheY-like chemotaxis protein